MRSLRIYLIIATALIAALASGGCSPKHKRLTTTVDVTAQEIMLSDEALQLGIKDTLQFGSMRQGEVVVKSLRIRNCTSQPIVLLRHATSCGCVKVSYDRKPIATGESLMVDFEFDSKSLQGWQMKLLELYFADKDTPVKIYIDAEVE
jgi:hypothetical protein